MATFTFIDTRLRETTTVSYMIEGQHRFNEMLTTTYFRMQDGPYVQVTQAEYTAERSFLIAQNCQIIRLDPSVEVTSALLENPLHRRVTIIKNRDMILRIRVANPAPIPEGMSNGARI